MKYASMKKMLSRSIITLAVFATAFLSRATDYTWTGGGSNALWSNPANWGGSGAPTNAVDHAIFDSQASVPHTVLFDSNRTNDQIEVRRDNVTIDLQGYTYTLQSWAGINVALLADQTGTLHVAGGSLVATDNDCLTSLANADGANGTFALSGSDTFFSSKYFYLGRSSKGVGMFRVEDGAHATVTQFMVGRMNTAVGTVVVSNATLVTGNPSTSMTSLVLGLDPGTRGEMLLTGPDARWLNGGGYPNVYVGHQGIGNLTIANGAKAPSGTHYLYIGANPGSTGTVTVTGAGSLIGGAYGQSTAYRVTIGANEGGTIVAPPPTTGIGELNLLDGGALHGVGTWGNYHFFIGSGSRIRIRDGSIIVDTVGNSTCRHPFLFSPGSFFTVELTQDTEAFTQTTPLIWSGADIADNNGLSRLNQITDANLEVIVTEGFDPQPGAVFQIFRYNGDLEGTFAGLPEASEFYAQGKRFRLDYGTRTGSVITLTVLPSIGSQFIIR